MKKIVLYLSGKYSGEIAENIARARTAAVALWGRGYAVLCPHLNTAHFEVDCTASYDDYIEGDCALIDGVDALVMLPEWEGSKGAKIEKAYAEAKGIPVYFYPDAPTDLTPKETVLQEADRIVGGARGSDYGHPLDDFGKTARLWSVVLGVPVTEEQVALCMIQVKVSREINKPKRDNRVDMAGYSKTLDMVISERARRGSASSDFLRKVPITGPVKA